MSRVTEKVDCQLKLLPYRSMFETFLIMKSDFRGVSGAG